MFHTTILAIEFDEPVFMDETEYSDELTLLSRAFRSTYKATLFNPRLVYLYDCYSYYLERPYEAIDDFRIEMMRMSTKRGERIRDMAVKVRRYDARNIVNIRDNLQ